MGAMSQAGRKIIEFSRAKLAELAEPLILHVQRKSGTFSTTVPLLQRSGMPPGHGYSIDEATNFMDPLIKIAGGGLYRISATDPTNKTYEWDIWIDPTQFPEKVLSTNAVAQAIMAPPEPPPPAQPNHFSGQMGPPPAAPSSMFAGHVPPMPQVQPPATHLSHPSQDWMHRVNHAPPPPPPSMTGQMSMGAAPYPYGMAYPGQPPAPYPYAQTPYGWQPPPPAVSPTVMFEKEMRDREQALLKREYESQLRDAEAKHQAQMTELRVANQSLAQRLDAVMHRLEGGGHGKESPELATIKSELDLTRRELAQSRQQSETEKMMSAVVAPLQAALSALQAQMQSVGQGGPSDAQVMASAVKDTATLMASTTQQQIQALRDTIPKQQPMTLPELASVLQSLKSTSGGEQMMAQVATAYGGVFDMLGKAMGIMQAQQPAEANPVAAGLMQVGERLVGTLGRYVEGVRQEKESNAQAKVIEAQAKIVSAQNPQVVVQQMMPPPQEAAQQQPLAGPQEVQQQQASPPAEGAPMDRSEQLTWEDENFGPAVDAIRQFRDGVRKKIEEKEFNAEEAASFLFQGFNHFAPRADKIPIYKFFERSMWKELLDAVLPDIMGDPKYALMQALHRRRNIESGRGDPNQSANEEDEQEEATPN